MTIPVNVHSVEESVFATRHFVGVCIRRLLIHRYLQKHDKPFLGADVASGCLRNLAARICPLAATCKEGVFGAG